MIKLKNNYFSSMLLLSVTILFVWGCQRRLLEDEVGDVAMIPFKINWNKSGLNIEKMHRATIRIFPHDGSPAYDFRLQDDLTEVNMPLAIGKYSFVIFNETIDAEDWTSLVFTGLDKYDDFAITTSEDGFRGLYSRAEDNLIRKTPEALASWSIDEFEVTKEMIVYTRALSRGQLSRADYRSPQEEQIWQALEKVTIIEPVSVVKTLNITARVQNLVSAQRSSGAIKGATESIQLSTRKPSQHLVTHVFVMNGRKYDDITKPQHGTIGATILIFDVKNYDELKCELLVDFLLHDGTTTPAEVFDVTKEITKDQVDITINVGFDVPGKPNDHPIILPTVPIGGGSVGVDDWDKVIVPIK